MKILKFRTRQLRSTAIIFVFAALILFAGSAVAVALPIVAAQSDVNPLSTLNAIILGIVEGVTEYLPVSSTGHLLLTEHTLGIAGNEKLKTAADSYAIAIQFGAILAVVFLYWKRLVSLVRGIFGRDRDGRRLAIALIFSFVPAAIIGFLGEKLIKGHLFALWPITAAWFVGGVVILLVARHDTRHHVRPDQGRTLEQLNTGRALLIGLLQCLAMWPGVSRSLVTILGGRLTGLSTAAAVEYSFLLGLVTLTAATAYEALSEGAAIIATFGIVTPIIGIIAAFISAAIAVKWMVTYLNRHTMAVFGWYRLALSVVVAALLITRVL